MPFPRSTILLVRAGAEIRRDRVSHDLDWLFASRRYPGEPGMSGLATTASEAERRIEGSVSRATRYYLSSARLTPERLAEAVRAHWGIENSLHWVLDVTFDEDRARNRKDNGPENLAILRRRRKRKRSGWSDAFARSIIRQMR